MRDRDDMTFPMEEYQRRLTELRQRMEKRLLDAVIISDPENLMYLTDYQTTGYSYFQALVVRWLVPMHAALSAWHSTQERILSNG